MRLAGEFVQVFQGFLNGEGVHLAADPFAGFDGPLQVVSGDLDGQGIVHGSASALVVFDPSGMRQSNPGGLAVSQEFDVHGIGVASGNGHDQGLVGAVDLFPGPAVSGAKIGVHGDTTIADACGSGQTGAIPRRDATKRANCYNPRMTPMPIRSGPKRRRTTASAARKRISDLHVLTSKRFTEVRWLVHGFSTRQGGVSEAYGGSALNLGVTAEDNREAVEENRRRFARAIGAGGGNRSKGRTWPMAMMKQIHSPVIHTVRKPQSDHLAGDGLVTQTRGLLLTVRVADCLPILLADRDRHAVGIFHAGWRGTLARIVEKGVGEMRRSFGSHPRDLVAAIGPGIHRCCYEVEDEFRERFAAQFDYAEALFEEVSDSDVLRLKYPMLFLNQRAPGHGLPPRKMHLDLVEANRRQLMDAGVPPENIDVIDLCTSCRTDLLFSHRAERGVTGRMMGAIGIRQP